MSLEDFRQERLKKLARIREAGMDPYPASSGRTHRVAEALDAFEGLSASGDEVTLAGRIMAQRGHGALTFLDLDDGSGTVQALVGADRIGDEAYAFFASVIDTGDLIEVSGPLTVTKRGEKSIEARRWKMLAKSIRPLPEKWHGLTDTEERLRRRYVDLIMRPEERALFVQKSKFWEATRQFLLAEGGLEVETPVLERIPGGADAEPFATHMNALDIDLYLRIAPELNLKRLIVGGYDKVFEIGRIFRNEGIDREHLQDYTQMEMYWAHYDYEKLMELVQRLVRAVVQATLGGTTHSFRGQTIDWGPAFKRVDYYEAFRKHTELDLASATASELETYARGQGIDTDEHKGRGRLIDIIFKKKVRPSLIEPAFLVLPPVDIEPLAKRYPADPSRVERFQIVACGSELGKGFSELNDPVDQLERFTEQSKLGEAGDKEAQRMDHEYVEALEQGMPPTAGFAYSERLFSFLVDRPIRETVFFPLVRPRDELAPSA
jgi:lysyl-tRNA synthetase class 2